MMFAKEGEGDGDGSFNVDVDDSSRHAGPG